MRICFFRATHTSVKLQVVFYIPQNFIKILQTKKKGRGVFARKKIPTGTIIGDYLGKLVAYREVDPEDYPFLMYLNDELGILADKNKEGVHLLNHSCNPNCSMYPYKGHTLFVATWDIEPQEELTISYMFPPEPCEKCDHDCFCESTNCTKTMHTQEQKYKKWRAYFEGKQEKLETKFLGKHLLPLENYPKIIRTR